ncbi:calnexin [Sinocyclocheilus anshuiensis]|uniref:Calnexin-like n=1 Tax=Sinocyclocheilus anshuiensis TaxID=1608454 RepID=A0A671RGU7_9TELE|nr:PREDICTED: calnexin-like [Sinocyclocheilus anshuiensis]
MMRCLLLGFCLCLAHISGAQNAYRRVAIPEQAYFAEAFDAGALDRNWVLSKAVKDEHLQLLKYNGEWVIEESRELRLLGNRGLVLKSPGEHHAISAYLKKTYHFTDKPLCLQYEVFFPKGVDCGGAYIKLLSHSDDLCLSRFSDATPYTIMFGPDKCGSSHKIHFIFRHRNPVTGTYEEKHARQPELDLSDYFTDQRPHLYTLNVYPDGSFEILVDLTLINKGSLLEDMLSSAASAHEAQEQEDSARAALVDAVQTSDTKLQQHRRSDEPFTVSSVSAVGFELWSLTADVMFDNILLCDSLEVARRWTQDTWGQRQTPGVIEKLLMATVKRPWLWGLYVVTVGLPIILFVSFMWPNKRFGPPDQDYYYKKTDKPQADRRQDSEEQVSHAEGAHPTRAEAESRAVRRARRNTDVS